MADNTEEAGTTTAARSVCLIASGDTEGWIIPCGCTSNQSGGLLRRGTYVQQRRRDHAVLVVDVGGAPDGNAPYQTARFEAILKGEAMMNIVAHNIGATEAAFGKTALMDLSQKSGVPFVSANVAEQNSPIAESHVTVESEGKRFLITGVLSPDLAPDNVTVIEPAEGVINLLDRLDEDFDHVVILAYCVTDELHQLARNLPEADVIIGGPTGQAVSPETIGRTMILSATNKGKFLADVRFQPGNPVPSGSIVEMSSTIENEPDQEENLKEFRSFLAKRDFNANESGLLDPDAATRTHDMTVSGSASCRECHSETNSHWDRTGHAHAWQKLKQEGAHVDPYCQHCHTTGYGLSGGFYSMSEGTHRIQVGCESCHGPSSAHVADSSVRTPFEAASICIKCHDHENSPHFEYESYWERIQHE